MTAKLTARFVVAGMACEATADTFKNTDVFEIEIAGDPQISPDGSQVAYTRLSNDIMIDRTRSNIWLVSADGRMHRPLLSGTGSYSSPRWSPDGGRLAYLSSAEGRGPELYVRWMDTGQTALLTNLPAGPGAISWSPDGESLAFEMFVESPGLELATAPQKPEGADGAAPVKIINELPYRVDGAG